MAELDFVLYDTVAFGTVAATETILFQVARGSDATHNEAFTNSRGAGALPSGEDFQLNWLGLAVDYNTVLADIPKLYLASFFELRVNDITVLQLPLVMIASNSGYGGHYTQAAAADEAVIGIMGDGFMLNKPIHIGGGVSFKPRIVQGTALAAGSSNMKLLLRGVLKTGSN